MGAIFSNDISLFGEYNRIDCITEQNMNKKNSDQETAFSG